MTTILLDKERTINFDLNAMAKFEEVTGKNLFKMEAMDNMSAGDYRVLVWVCLIKEDPDLTLEKVGSMITAENLASISESIGKGMSGGKAEDNPL